MEVRRFREDGSYYGNDLEESDIMCPNCTKDNVYNDIGDGDYYEGVTYYCLSCNFSFTMPSMGIEDNIQIFNNGVKIKLPFKK